MIGDGAVEWGSSPVMPRVEDGNELVCLDTFYIGKLKGVGKVWQITACDAASSYGLARILPALSAAAVSAGRIRARPYELAASQAVICQTLPTPLSLPM